MSWLPRITRDDAAKLVAAAVGGGLVVAGAAWALGRHAGSTAVKATVLTVRLELKPGKAAAFLALWQPLADYCRAHEPMTLCYEAAVSTDNPDVILIYERYVSDEALTITHVSSAQFKAFGAALAAADIVVAKNTTKYTDTGVGFATR